MKRLFAPLLALATCTLCLADVRQDVQAAAKKVAEAPGYTWTTSTEIEGGNWAGATVTGKSLKGSFALITSERDGNVTTAVLKGDKGVLKTDEGWKTAEDLRGGGGGGGGGGRGNRGAMLLRTRLPVQDAVRMLEAPDQVAELKSGDGGVVSGDLTEKGAKELLTFGRGRGGQGGQAPEPKNAKGSVKFWVKDGQLTKYQVRVSGTLSFNGEDRDMARTTTYEIKDVGTTEVKVPKEATKALGS